MPLSDTEIHQHELDMLRQEKLRRASQQFEYVRLSLINIGVLSFFGIVSVAFESEDLFTKLSENGSFVFALMCVLTVVSITLFLFWIDDALTIAGIDRYLTHKEEQVDKSGDVYWYEYRRGLNSTASFIVKKWIFNLAIVLSFISPPFLFLMFSLLHTALQIPVWAQLASGGAFLVLLVVPLIIWRSFSRRLYG